MSNRELCINIINELDDYQLESATSMLKALLNVIEHTKLLDGRNTPLAECVEDDDAW